MLYQVTKNHFSNFPNPLILNKGEQVFVRELYQGDEDWPNWRYCIKLDESQSGWVPEQIILITGQTGEIIEDYTANELTVSIGEIVSGLNELNGWIFCRDLSNQEGWIPKKNLIRLD